MRLARLTGLEREQACKRNTPSWKRPSRICEPCWRTNRWCWDIINDGDSRPSRTSTPTSAAREISPLEGEIDMEDLIQEDGRGGDADALRLRQAHARARPTAAQNRGGKGVSGMTTREEDLRRAACSSPPRTTRSCSSPTAAACTASRATKSPRRAAPRGARRLSTCCSSTGGEKVTAMIPMPSGDARASTWSWRRAAA